MKIEQDPLLKSISARFSCIEELISNGDIQGALSVIRHIKTVLPEPDEVNIQAALNEVKGNG